MQVTPKRTSNQIKQLYEDFMQLKGKLSEGKQNKKKQNIQLDNQLHQDMMQCITPIKNIRKNMNQSGQTVQEYHKNSPSCQLLQQYKSHYQYSIKKVLQSRQNRQHKKSIKQTTTKVPQITKKLTFNEYKQENNYQNKIYNQVNEMFQQFENKINMKMNQVDEKIFKTQTNIKNYMNVRD